MQSQSLISGSDLLEEMLDDVFAERLDIILISQRKKNFLLMTGI